jgi:glycerol-3-phosphate dehydrogenase
VRPLPASDDSFTGRIPRDHFCTFVETEDTPPVLCMIGGKWTTFRSFGELAASMTLERLGRSLRVQTADRAIGGGRDFPRDIAGWIAGLAARTSLAPERLAALFDRYGTNTAVVAEFITQGADEALPDSDFTIREILFLIRTEGVEHLDDILLRRTTLAISGALSLAAADVVLEILAAERGWDDLRRGAERQRFLTLLAERHGVSEQVLISRNKDRSIPCEATAKSG